MARRRYQRGHLRLRAKKEKVWVTKWREDCPSSGWLCASRSEGRRAGYSERIQDATPGRTCTRTATRRHRNHIRPTCGYSRRQEFVPAKSACFLCEIFSSIKVPSKSRKAYGTEDSDGKVTQGQPALRNLSSTGRTPAAGRPPVATESTRSSLRDEKRDALGHRRSSQKKNCRVVPNCSLQFLSP